MSFITDGTGSGYKAAVTDSNRLKVDAVTEDSFVEAAEEGTAFNINTEAVSYSGTGPFTAGALYVKNNESVDMEVVGFFIGEGASRTGSDTTTPLLFKMYGNPTGTITGSGVADVVNRRIGAAREFDIETLKEPTGYTVAGAPLLYQYHYGGRGFGTVNFVIPPGQSILVEVDSAADTFNMYTGFTGYLRS